MSKDHLITAVLFVLVTTLTLRWRVSHTPAVWEPIFASLRHECDPANPEADYFFVQTALPTERKREAIIQRCREVGASLLPAVKRQIDLETDDELRGMLTVIAAALGDEASREPAARAMTGFDYPALKITAAKTLRHLHDPKLVPWFRLALTDHHFVVNGGCGLQREQFFPVRTIAAIALKEMNRIAETDE